MSSDLVCPNCGSCEFACEFVRYDTYALVVSDKIFEEVGTGFPEIKFEVCRICGHEVSEELNKKLVKFVYENDL